MAEYAELVLEGAGPMIEHYDKVYEPVKERVKKIPKKIPGLKSRSGQDEYEEEDVIEYDNYDSQGRGTKDRSQNQEVVEYKTYEPPPQRSNTERSRRDDDEDFDPPRRSNTERPREHRRHKSRHRRGDRYVEEEYVYESKGGRAKSAGRDGPYGGGGRGLRDDRNKSRKNSKVCSVEGC